MIVSRAQIIFLLFFIGSERSLAYLHATNVEQNINNEEETAKPINDEKDEDHQKQLWNCQAESDYFREQTTLIAKMFGDSEKVTENQESLSTDETVLVLGKTGSGKSSLIQFLTQNSKLQSKKVRADTGEYIIDDGEKVGTSATESSTLYPEIFSYNSSITFCDSPGFQDSRSFAHEIVTMNVLKSTISRFKRIKILLLENYSSLQYGLSKDNFINTLRYLNDFLINIHRYKDNIVLIATKMPFTYKMADDGDSAVVPELITEEMHIESIMEYLNLLETSIARKLTEKLNKNDKEFYQKVIKLLQHLQTRDKDGKATRINVFRRPYKSGPLINMPLLEKNKESLTKTIMNLNFVVVGKNDFGFTLSDKAKLYLECLLKLTIDSYKNKINEVSFKLNEFVIQKTQNYTSYYQVTSDLESMHDALKHLSRNLDRTTNFDQLFKEINNFISKLEVPLQFGQNGNTLGLEKYAGVLLKITDKGLHFNPSYLTLPLRQVTEFTEEKLVWHKALIKYIEGLSSYEVQKNKTKIYSTIFHKGSTSTNDLMNLFMSITESNVKNLVDLHVQEHTKRRFELESITKTLLQQSYIACHANGRLLLKGFQIRIGEINLQDLVHSYCNNITVKEVVLLAVDTVFLDEDTIDIYRGVNMFIAAPKWEVIGQRKIVLSGQPGPEISNDKPYAANGKDGRPGLPGGNGGSFFGIGLQFLNGNSLRVESNGGRGGPGTNGAKGATGFNGRDASEKLKLGIYNHSYEFYKGVRSNDMESSISQHSAAEEEDFHLHTGILERFYAYKAHTIVQVITEDGECGSNGVAGGFGGESGMGGFAGVQQLIELRDDSSQIAMQNQNGDMGKRGSMGETGDRGTDGIGMICVQVKNNRTGFPKDYYLPSFWKCESTNITSPACNTCQKLDENFGNQYTSTGIEQPAPRKLLHLGQNLLDYSSLLGAHTFHPIFSRIIADFRNAVLQKNSSPKWGSNFQEFRSMLESTSSII